MVQIQSLGFLGFLNGRCRDMARREAEGGRRNWLLLGYLGRAT